MVILAIETSCDDTCVAIVKTQGQRQLCFKILSNITSSQVKIHRKYGGVYPTLARREHEKNLVAVLIKAFEKAGLPRNSKSQTLNPKQIQNPKSKTDLRLKAKKIKTLEEIFERHKTLLKETEKFFTKYQEPKIDIVAVTVGPGLEPCLWTGVNFAKALSFWWNLPIIPVNHIEAHILVNFLELPTAHYQLSTTLFPAICLVVSGGHTQLILMRNFGKYKIIGETRDDAAGECFDKTARVLGLPYPGGPAIAAEAAKCRNIKISKYQIKLPRPMIYSKDYDFSFSGLKTAVLYDFKKRSLKTRKSKKYIREMAAEIQQAINDVLIKKTIKAARDFRAKTVILGGGVAANDELRKQLNHKLKTINHKLNFFAPPKNLCTDNAAMIAVTAFFHKNNKKPWQKIKAKANLRIS